MKQKLLALVCALALVVSLAGCVISTPDTVGSLGDYEISSGLYLLAQYDAYQKAADLASSDQDAANVKAFLKQTITVDSDSGETNEHLFKSIDDLELSVRATNCLRSANIALVGELVQRSEAEMLKTKNFGRKSLDEIKEVLHDMGLDFGMKVDGFEKKYQDWKRKQQNEA